MPDTWDFDAFLTGTVPALTGYCAAIVGNADGEDAAQEAFVRLWQNREKIPNEAAAAVFVYRTAYRLCVDALRRRKREQTAESPANSPAEDWKRQEDRQTSQPDRLTHRMQDALRQLSPADRAIVYSRVLEEADYRQIAERFGKTEAWARKRYSLARAKLEKLLTMPQKQEEEHG